MAAAARPGPSDARVPCPLCGGLIHPIAGRCKHCKADLTSYHASRPAQPAATSPLPALSATGRNGEPAAPAAINGHAGPPTASVAAAAAGQVRHASAGHGASPAGPRVAARETAQPVLPPRPLPGYPAQPRPSSWRHWPVIVIVVAMLAIIAALVLMLWPADARGRVDGKRVLPPPPAPERMQTEPQVAPPVKPQADLGQRLDPAPGASDDSVADPSQPPGASDDGARPDPFLGTARPGGQAVAVAMIAQLCRKLLVCRKPDDSFKEFCEAFARSPVVPPDHCPAAVRCFERIDSLGCDDQFALLSDFDQTITKFTDCVAAIGC